MKVPGVKLMLACVCTLCRLQHDMYTYIRLVGVAGCTRSYRVAVGRSYEALSERRQA